MIPPEGAPGVVDVPRAPSSGLGVQHGRSAQHRMTSEVKFLVLGEDPQPGRPARQVHTGQERRLELADLPGELLHHCRGQVLRIQDHHQPVALKRLTSRQRVPRTKQPPSRAARLARRLVPEQAQFSRPHARTPADHRVRYAVAVRPARSILACHSRAAAAVSREALPEVLGLRLTKYRPVMPSTWGEEAR